MLVGWCGGQTGDLWKKVVSVDYANKIQNVIRTRGWLWLFPLAQGYFLSRQWKWEKATQNFPLRQPRIFSWRKIIFLFHNNPITEWWWSLESCVDKNTRPNVGPTEKAPGYWFMQQWPQKHQLQFKTLVRVENLQAPESELYSNLNSTFNSWPCHLGRSGCISMFIKTQG